MIERLADSSVSIGLCAGYSADHGCVRPCRSVLALCPGADGNVYCDRHHPSRLPDRIRRLVRRRSGKAGELAAAYGTTVEALLGPRIADAKRGCLTPRQVAVLERIVQRSDLDPADRLTANGALRRLRESMSGV